MSFQQFNLDARLMTSIARSGYDVPTPIQVAAIPAVLAGSDLIGTAQTGTGKTAAFVLPILHRLLTHPRRGSRALIVTPTRELAEQIHETIGELARGTRLRSATIYGGVGAHPQIRALRGGTDILVACPGRLLDHINQGAANLSQIEMLVLDEADRMLDMGFMPDVRRILHHLPRERQTMLFSATFPPEIEDLAAETLRDPERVAVGLSRPAHTVSHALYPVAAHLKTPFLLALLKHTDSESVLVFTKTKHRAERLSRQIGRSGFKATSLHGDRSQNQRQAALKGFKQGAYQVMVATDIAARGLDISSVTHVINYDMPDGADAYIHRIGRTGRAERTGDAFTLTTPEDRVMIRTLERTMGKKLTRLTLPDFDYETPSDQPVYNHDEVKQSRRQARSQPSPAEQDKPKGKWQQRRPRAERRSADAPQSNEGAWEQSQGAMDRPEGDPTARKRSDRGPFNGKSKKATTSAGRPRRDARTRNGAGPLRRSR